MFFFACDWSFESSATLSLMVKKRHFMMFLILWQVRSGQVSSSKLMGTRKKWIRADKQQILIYNNMYDIVKLTNPFLGGIWLRQKKIDIMCFSWQNHPSGLWTKRRWNFRVWPRGRVRYMICSRFSSKRSLTSKLSVDIYLK